MTKYEILQNRRDNFISAAIKANCAKMKNLWLFRARVTNFELNILKNCSIEKIQEDENGL